MCKTQLIGSPADDQMLQTYPMTLGLFDLKQILAPRGADIGDEEPQLLSTAWEARLLLYFSNNRNPSSVRSRFQKDHGRVDINQISPLQILTRLGGASLAKTGEAPEFEINFKTIIRFVLSWGVGERSSAWQMPTPSRTLRTQKTFFQGIWMHLVTHVLKIPA